MVAVLEAWVANKDAAMFPFDAKITSRYADHLGEVVEVDLLGEMTVLPIFRNPKKKKKMHNHFENSELFYRQPKCRTSRPHSGA